MSKAERIQALQAFLGYFNPAEAERMAQGGGAQLDAESEASRVDRVSALTDHVADESFWRSLSALQDAFPDLEVVIENSIAEGDQVAIRFAVPSH
jgi:predicted ester cyclase